MSAMMPPEVQALLDKQAIWECLNRYCRGIDRFDADLLRKAYWPDAEDDHGEFVGNVEDFIRWVFALHELNQISTQHQLTTHNIELDGHSAHGETYYIYTVRNRDESVWIAGGRYIDRFEKRGDEWRIASRYCITEWSGTIDEGPVPYLDIPDVHASGVPSRDRTDPSYTRPLVNRRQPRFPQPSVQVGR